MDYIVTNIASPQGQGFVTVTLTSVVATNIPGAPAVPQSTLNLPVALADAGEYVAGSIYTLTLTPAAPAVAEQTAAGEEAPTKRAARAEKPE